MIYMAVSCVIGLLLGVFSAYYQKTFLAMLFGLPPALAILGKVLGPFVPLLAMSGVGEGGLFSAYAAFFGMLPQGVQDSIVIFPGFVVFGRLCAWLRIKYSKPKEAESHAARKQRILKDFGYKDGMPY